MTHKFKNTQGLEKGRSRGDSLAREIKHWAQALGFAKIGITDTDLSHARGKIQDWLDRQYHGEMGFMEQDLEKRLDPGKLMPEAHRVICVAMPYLTEEAFHRTIDPHQGYISAFALGGDYHRFVRKKLDQLAHQIESETGTLVFRAFSDSAPVLERALAEKAGMGWIGKNALLINQEMGSYFFLGELFVNLDLPLDAPSQNFCGTCEACLAHCPTKAIVSPRVVDARRCVAYLTIEHPNDIPKALQPAIGNRIFGCDACQQCCPWNRHAILSQEPHFQPRDYWLHSTLEELLQWDEKIFLEKTKGSPIRRLGHKRWQRNIAVALKNRS